MLATIPSATLFGVDGRPVSVEVHAGNGLPSFAVVGLPDASCREARDRVRAALESSGFRWPMRRMTVNLAPSGLRKGGAGLDLAIAIGVLVVTGELDPRHVADCGFVGELGLDGAVRRVSGLLALADAVRAGAVVVGHQGVTEASLAGRRTVRGARSLRELVAALRGDGPWPDPPRARAAPPEPVPDLADVRGQRLGRWAAEVAAAGGHHLLLIGPPGAGKTMLAHRLGGLLPELTADQAVETTKIHSAAGLALPPSGLIRRPPVRCPHHSASLVALVGGGTALLRPGEVSLANHGVLVLDEMAEFPALALDALREPLEDGVVRLCRARATVCFPARFLLVGAMNPCPCGEGGPPGSCRCSDPDRARYGRRLSGPLLDRFDLRVFLRRPDATELVGGRRGEDTATVAQRVAAVRTRCAERGVACNAALSAAALDRWAQLTPAARAVLEHRLRAGSLSARGVDRVRRVARTLADLEGREGPLDEADVCGALELRVAPVALELTP